MASKCPHKKSAPKAPQKAKGPKQGTAKALEEPEGETSDHSAGSVKHEAAAVSMASALIASSCTEDYLFDSGATHVLLPLSALAKEHTQESSKIYMRLAAGAGTIGRVYKGEVFAKGVTKALLPAGRICRYLGVRFAWDEYGPRLLAKGRKAMLPIIWMAVRNHLPYVEAEDALVTREFLRDKDRKGHATYQEWRQNLDLADEEEVDNDPLGEVTKDTDALLKQQVRSAVKVQYASPEASRAETIGCDPTIKLVQQCACGPKGKTIDSRGGIEGLDPSGSNVHRCRNQPEADNELTTRDQEEARDVTLAVEGNATTLGEPLVADRETREEAYIDNGVKDTSVQDNIMRENIEEDRFTNMRMMWETFDGQDQSQASADDEPELDALIEELAQFKEQCSFRDAETDEELLKLVESLQVKRPSQEEYVDRRKKLEEHEATGHVTKQKDCPVCQEADGPPHQHHRKSKEEQGLHVLHADLSGPHKVAVTSDGTEAAYAVVTVLRTQVVDTGAGVWAKPGKTLLLPWIRLTATKNQLEVAEAIDSIITEIEAMPTDGVPYGKRVLRVQTDRGKEWLNHTLEESLKGKGVHHTTTQGYDPKANGTAERFVGIVKTVARRMLRAASLPDDYWTWAMEHAAMALRVKALTDGAIIPFGEQVAIRLMGPKTNWHAKGTTGQLLKLDTHTRASWVLTEQGEIVKGTAPVKITQLNSRLGEDSKHGPWQKVVAPTGQPFWSREAAKVTQWREPHAVELQEERPMEHRAQRQNPIHFQLTPEQTL